MAGAASFSLQRALTARCSLTMFAALLGLALWGYLGVRDALNTPPGSRIQLTVRAHGVDAVIMVEDNGPGVSDEVLPRLFEPFYRSDAARAREGGPGLGLTATAAIVTLHRGTVVAQRGSEGGLLVTVTLPLVVPGSVA